jgi:hypothetical protein
MEYLVAIVILVVLFAVFAGLIYALFQAYQRLSRLHFLLLLIALVAIPYPALKHWETGFKLSSVPDALNVTSISYSEEKSWGLGPGGNETGIRVYPLPEQIANEISQRGLEFFNTLPPNHQHSGAWRGRYEKWLETPIRPDSHWEPTGKTAKLDIHDYICAYGFCIDIKPSVVEEANAIVNSAGSYYAYGRIGIIVVSPIQKLVLYMYNG